jgi:hypothetical protein
MGLFQIKRARYFDTTPYTISAKNNAEKFDPILIRQRQPSWS